jgi:hypothetical protein
MGIERARKLVRGEEADTFCWWESMDNPDWVRSHAKPGEEFQQTFLRLVREFDMDIVMGVPTGETTVGTAPPYLHDLTIEDIYRFDPFNPPTGQPIDYVKCIGIDLNASVDEFAAHFQAKLDRQKQQLGDIALCPMPQWHQIFHYITTTFGLEQTSFAAYTDPDAFRELLKRFAALTKKVYQAWAKTDIELILAHDDIAMVSGPIFDPGWYAQEIFPLYDEIWQPLRDANIPFIFASDGKIDDLIPGISPLGPAGFFLDDMVDFEAVAQKVGEKHFFIGNASVNTLTYKDEAAIEADIDRCVATGKKCRGHVMQVSGHLMPNIANGKIDFYFDAVSKRRGV